MENPSREDKLCSLSQEEKINKGKKPFIRENIAGGVKKIQKEKIIFGLAVAAIFFGAVASLSFVLFQSLWKNCFAEKEESDLISIFQDEDTEEGLSLSGDTQGTHTEDETASSSAEGNGTWRENVQAMIDADLADMKDHDSLYHEKYSVVQTAYRSLVTVTCSIREKDWFDNEINSGEETCGLIISMSANEILILLNASSLEGGGEILVNFNGYGEAEATVKQTDEVTGLAVIAVDSSRVDETVQEKCSAISMGNSYLCVQGEAVIVIGSPLGYTKSLAYGVVSYVNSNVQETDSLFRLIQTDIPYTEGAEGILINSEGALVGWITTAYSGKETTEGFLAALSLSDLKTVIEKLSNEMPMSSLGIQGQNVTEDIAEEENLPIGIYITKCLSGKAADLAGMQNGDILTGIGDEEISTMKELQSCLAQYSPGDVVIVTLQRYGREGYQKITYTVTLDSRAIS